MAVALVLLSHGAGCESTRRGLSALQIGCDPSEVTVGDVRHAMLTSYWTAMCRGQSFLCHWEDESSTTTTVTSRGDVAIGTTRGSSRVVCVHSLEQPSVGSDTAGAELLLADLPFSEREVVRRVSEASSCEPRDIVTRRAPNVGRATAYAVRDCHGAEGTCVVLDDEVSCRVTRSAPAPAEPTPGTRGVERPEVLRVLESLQPEVRACAEGSSDGGILLLRLQINGDGTAIFLGTDPPTRDAARSRCLRELVATMRFRATGAPPIELRSNPFRVGGPSDDAAPDAPAEPQP